MLLNITKSVRFAEVQENEILEIILVNNLMQAIGVRGNDRYR